MKKTIPSANTIHFAGPFVFLIIYDIKVGNPKIYAASKKREAPIGGIIPLLIHQMNEPKKNSAGVGDLQKKLLKSGIICARKSMVTPIKSPQYSDFILIASFFLI